MPDSGATRASPDRKKPFRLRRSLCCSFAGPNSPDHLPTSHKRTPKTTTIISAAKPSPLHNSNPNSFPNSPNPRSGLAFMRIRSPGRVSPIDPDPAPQLDPRPGDVASSPDSRSQTAEPSPSSAVAEEPKVAVVVREKPISNSLVAKMAANPKEEAYDVRLDIRGINGGRLVMELDCEVLRRHSPVLAEKMGSRDAIEVREVQDLGLFRDTLELMCENDMNIRNRISKFEVSHSIGILEVSTEIKFGLAIASCLNYLEAVPYTDNEEEKLKSLFAKFTYVGTKAHDILARLYPQEQASSPPLDIHLVQAVMKGADHGATGELKTLVKGLLSQSSVYQKNPAGINKEALYRVCDSCLCSLVQLFQEASSISVPTTKDEVKQQPLIGRISKQVENLNWLLDILIDKQVGEDFVGLWAKQTELINMRKKCSPMVRYELSRVSAYVFIALGRGKLHCRREDRCNAFRAWFGPMLYDFGWLQRCSKGLDVRELEDAMGQALLTLPLEQQQSFFMDWFGCFSKCGFECPNLSCAFQIWWRRWSSLKSSLALNTEP